MQRGGIYQKETISLYGPDSTRPQQDIHQRWPCLSVARRSSCYISSPSDVPCCPSQDQQTHPTRRKWSVFLTTNAPAKCVLVYIRYVDSMLGVIPAPAFFFTDDIQDTASGIFTPVLSLKVFGRVPDSAHSVILQPACHFVSSS